MNNKYILILFISISAQISISQINEVNKKLDYTIEWPMNPVFTSDTIEFNNIIVENQLWDLTVDNESHPNWRYYISIDKYPSDYIHSDSIQLVLDQFINSSQNLYQEDNSYELISASETRINNYYGKVFRWKNNDDNEYLKIIVYVIENSVYQLGVNNRSNQSHNIQAKYFFDSFKIDEDLYGQSMSNKSTYVPKYEIDFPDTPETSTQIVDSEIGKLTLHLKILEPENDNNNRFYMVGETAYPKDAVSNLEGYELDKFYIESINGSLNSVNGTLISLNNIQYEDYVGKEFKCSISEGSFVLIYRLFLINNQLYTIGVMTTPEELNNNLLTSFFDSFKIIQ